MKKEFNQKLTEREERVLQYFICNHKGRKNAVLSKEAGETLGMSEKKLQQIIHSLRAKEKAIGSGKEGYFFCDNAAEVVYSMNNLDVVKKGVDEAYYGLAATLYGYGGGAGG